MNLIELLVFIGLIVLGGFLGAGIAALIGLICGGNTSKIVGHGEAIGSVATLLGLVFWGMWFGKMDKIHPPCRCGKSDWKDFELSRLKITEMYGNALWETISVAEMAIMV